jgi:hypothetical protein
MKPKWYILVCSRRFFQTRPPGVVYVSSNSSVVVVGVKTSSVVVVVVKTSSVVVVVVETSSVVVVVVGIIKTPLYVNIYKKLAQTRGVMRLINYNIRMKLYFVRFNYNDHRKDTEPCFYKIGITKHYDVLERFNRKDGQYDCFDIKVICSAYGPESEVKEAEKELLSLYPKNFWLEEKISGVTEIVRLNKEQVTELKNRVLDYRSKWFNQRSAEQVS